MNNQLDLQEVREEAEFLSKRAWDFIDKLEKLNKELEATTDCDKRNSLLSRIKNTNRLLDDYKVEYKILCDETGISPVMLALDTPPHDIVSTLGRKTLKTRNDLIKSQKIDLPPFFKETVPSRNPLFTGRQSEVRNFIKRVLAGGAFTICGVKGMGGIGKSEIAKEVCHLFHETWKKQPKLPEYIIDLLIKEKMEPGFFRDGILWIQFEPERQTAKTLSEYLIPKLFEPRIAEKIHNLDSLVDILMGKDVLVVLDSVEQNLRTFDYVLERFKGRFPLIITSRIAIPGIHAVDIDVLTNEEAEALFINLLENPVLSGEQRHSVAELCRLLGNYPLLIQIVASLVQADNGNLNDLKANYQNNPNLLLGESGRDTGIEERNAFVKSCFTISFQKLDEQQQFVFLHTALFNNPFTVSALAALLDVADDAEMELIVKRLLRLSLLNRLKDRPGHAITYDLHPLMRGFALDLLMQKVELTLGRKEQINTFLESLKQAEKDKVLQELLQDYVIIQQAVEAMEYCDRVFDFSSVTNFMKLLNGSLDDYGYWNEKIHTNRLAVRAAVALQTRSSQAFWLLQLADTLNRKANTIEGLKKAKTAFEQALVIYHELKDTESILFIQYTLTEMEKDLQLWSAAIRSCYQGIRECCRPGVIRTLGGFLKTLGHIYLNFTMEMASPFFQLNFKIKLDHVGEKWEMENLLRAYNDNIDVLYNQGRIESCLPLYHHAMLLAQSLKSTGDCMQCSLDLFRCYLHLQNIPACRQYLEIYVQLSTRMGFAESTRRTITGCFAWLNKDYAAAVQEFTMALAEDDLHQDFLHYWLGKAYLYQGDFVSAEDFLNRALAHHRSHNNAVQMAKIYSQLALLALNQGEIRQAVQYFGTSEKSQQAHGVKISPEELKIQHAIREQLMLEQEGAELYESLATEAKPIDLKPDFMLEILPESCISQDEKSMQLVTEGPVFIGRGKIEKPSTDELLDNINRYLYPFAQYSGDDQLPSLPPSTFDKDKLLFLLEQSLVMPAEKKQELVSTLANFSEHHILELTKLLEVEYNASHAKAKEIYLYPFYIDREPVSNEEYQVFCAAIGHPVPDHWPDGKIPDKAGHLPVVNVCLVDAKAYARWADKEIPTAAELEKACRGEQGLLYPWGNEWDGSQVHAKDGTIRKQFDAEYLVLNATIPTQGGMLQFKTPRFTLPPHENKMDETEFLNYLQGSISLSLDEKRRICNSLPKLSQYQVDELLGILREEKSKFEALDKIHEPQLNQIRKNHYISLMQSELTGLYLHSLARPAIKQGPYGLFDLVGSIYQLTVSESGSSFLIKGGSWFSEKPELSCQGWATEIISQYDKRMDVGFRCVKPIFSQEDLMMPPVATDCQTGK